MRTYTAIAAWILLAAIFVFTDGPLSLRPETGLSPNLERFFALLVVGFAFALAYPKRPLFAAALILLSIGLFEFLQVFIHYRHGTLHDARIKYAGGAVGVVGGLLVNSFLSRKRSSSL